MSDENPGIGTAGAPVLVRAATADDLPRLLAVQAAAFPAPDRTLLRRGVRAGLALVAVGGSVASGPAGDEPVGYALFTADGESVYVAELAVAPGHRRRGHGRRLLAAVAVRHPECEQLRLTTRGDNDDARAFYAALGFQEERRLPGYYPGEGEEGATHGSGERGGADDPVDGVLLVRDLE